MYVQALQASWTLRYLDGYRSPWKFIFDAWVCLDPVDRAAVLLPTPGYNTFTSLTYRVSCIPTFWPKAAEAIRSLTLNPI